MSILFAASARVNSFSLIELDGRRHVQFADGKVLSHYLVRNMLRAMGKTNPAAKDMLAAIEKVAGYGVSKGNKKVAGERIHRVFQSKSHSHTSARRAVNRDSFTLEAVYRLFGYKASLTVGKQAVTSERPTFKSVGAAVNEDLQSQHNKANNAGSKPQGGAMADFTAIHKLVKLAVDAGGIHACDINTGKEGADGPIVAQLCYVVNHGEKIVPVSNKLPLDSINRHSDWLNFLNPEYLEGTSYTLGLGYTGNHEKGLAFVTSSEFCAQACRGMFVMYQNHTYEYAGSNWGSAAYIQPGADGNCQTLFGIDENGKYVAVDHSVDFYLIANLDGRQARNDKEPAGVAVESIRQYVRDMVYTNSHEESMHLDMFLENNPNFCVDVKESLNDCMATGEPRYFNGKPSQVHLALVVAQVAANEQGVNDIEFWKSTAGSLGQARIRYNKASIVYLPFSAFFDVFKPTPDFGCFDKWNTGLWPLFPQANRTSVDTRTLCDLVGKYGAKLWSAYDKYCLPDLGDLTMSNTPQVGGVIAEAETITVVAESVLAEAAAVEEIDDSQFAAELKAYDAARKAALVGSPIKEFDWKAFLKAGGHLTTIQEVKKEDFSGGYNLAALAVASVAGKMSCAVEGRVICKGYQWEKRHLETLIEIISYVNPGGVVQDVTGKEYKFKGYFKVVDNADGSFDLYMEGAPTFRFLPNRVVVDLRRGRIFHNTVELAYPDQKKLCVKVADSFSNFMHYFVNGVMVLMGAYFDKALPANFKENCLSFLDKMPSIKMSKDNWQEENGAARHLMENSWVPTIAYVAPFLGPDGKIHQLGAGAASLGKIHSRFEKLNKVWEKKGNKNVLVVKSINDMNTGALADIMGKYCLESHFTKACYVPFGSVHVSLLVKHCPTLLKSAERFLGRDFSSNKVAAVIIMTLKATKGLKRLSLWMAQAAEAANPKTAGFQLRNMGIRAAGTAVNVMLAPSMVYAPGQNLFVNPHKEIAAIVRKTERNFMLNSYKIEEGEQHPFDFTTSTLESFIDNEWTVDTERGDGFTYVIPQRPAHIEVKKGQKPLLFTVKTDDVNAIDVNDVYHERDYEGQLEWIRFQERQSVSRKDSNLVIEYKLFWKENTPKIRSFNKAQPIRTSDIIVRNSLNPSLEGIEFDMICTQDALKLDVLYSMLMLIANTVNANFRNGNKSLEMAEMFGMIRRINASMGFDTKEEDPVLIIDEVAVIAGLYKDLLNYFEQHFVHPNGIWFAWQNSETQTRIVYEIYSNKAAEGKEWIAVANPLETFPELQEKFSNANLVCYREVGALTERTNVLVFVMDGKRPIAYMQRTYVICGNKNAPLVNIELYESSTVQESVSISNIRMPEIVGIKQAIKNPELAIQVQREMLEGGRKSMLNFLSLAYAEADLKVHSSVQDINITQYGNILHISDEDKAKLWDALKAGGVCESDMQIRGTNSFKKVCRALRYFNFVMPKAYIVDSGSDDWGDCYDYGLDDGSSFDGEDYTPATCSTSANYRLWLPALHSFSKLTSRNENNQDFVSIFYKDILKPLLRGEETLAKNSQRCFYVMRSLLNSENIICLPNGKQNVTAKRVAVGEARPGEVHITESNRAISAYQRCRRVGFDVVKAKSEDVFGHGARAPIALGYVFKLVIRYNVKVDGAIVQYIKRPGEAPVKATYILSDVQIGCDMFLPTCYDRGDFDGDGFYITPIHTPGVVANTWEDGYAILKAASRLAPFDAENGSYFCDHYGIKTYAAAMKTMGSGIVGAINKSAVVDLATHAENNKAAILVQHGAVGVAYAVYMIGMIMVNIMSYLGEHAIDDAKTAFKQTIFKVFMRPDAEYLTGLVGEMYEVMLGGYDKAPDAYRKRILDAVVEGKSFNTIRPADGSTDAVVEENLKAVKEVMGQLGFDQKDYVEVAAIMQLTCMYYNVKSKYKAPTAEFYNEMNWVATATFIFELGRGNFNGFRGVGRPNEAYSDNESVKAKATAYQACADMSFFFIKHLQNHVAKNVYFYALNSVHTTLGNVITCSPAGMAGKYWSIEDLKLFADACADSAIEVEATEVEDDSDDDNGDGGNVVTPSNDNDGDDDGGAAAEVETIKTEEVMPQETKRGQVHLVKHITRQMLKNNPNALFVFGDNFERRGMGGQAKEMRGEPNAVGIATKHKPSMSADAFLTDADYALAKDEFVNKIGYLAEMLKAGKDIYFPEDGIGTGLSALADHSVCIWNYLTLCLRVNLGITKFLPVSEPVQETITADSTTESAEPAGATEQTLSEDWGGAVEDDDDSVYDQDMFEESEDWDDMSEEYGAPAEVEPQQVYTETISVLDQLLAAHGDITIKQAKQLLQQSNAEQHNKVNKQDEVVVSDVPDMKEIVEEAAAIVDETPTYTPAAAPSRDGDVKPEANQIEMEEETLETVQAPARVTEETKPVEPAAPSAHNTEKVKELMSSLTEEQKTVVKSVGNDKRNVFLTGKGGAGKSYTVDIIRKCYDILGYPYIVVGSTGTSVVNINGHNTFNGMFGLLTGFKTKKDNPSDITRTELEWLALRNACRTSKQLKKRLPELKDKMQRHQRPVLIILDEVSQSDSLLLSLVEDALQNMKLDHHWLLVGDPMQFEPVNGYLFFKDVAVTKGDGTKVIKKSIYNMPELNFIGYNLKDNMRAKGDKEWANALDIIRMHHIQDELPAIVNERWEYSLHNPAPADALVLAPTNKTVKKFNDAATRKLIQAGAITQIYPGVVETKVKAAGQPDDYWLWSGKGEDRVTIFAPIAYKLTLCVGMRVMLRGTNIKNGYGDLEVNNGQTGTVKHLGKNYALVKFDNGVTKEIKAVVMEDPLERGTFSQLPLTPAYALTINKAQGMTFDIPVVFHMYTETKTGKVIPVMMENAFYVALSRLTTSDNCYFETKVSGTSPNGKDAGLSPKQLLLKSFKTNMEAREFVYDLK